MILKILTYEIIALASEIVFEVGIRNRVLNEEDSSYVTTPLDVPCAI